MEADVRRVGHDSGFAIAARTRGGNQAGAGNFLPAVFNTTAIANFPTQQSGSITNVTNCDPNWQMGYVGTRTQWNITSQFYMGVGVRPSGPSTISVAPASYGPSTAAGFLSCIATGQ